MTRLSAARMAAARSSGPSALITIRGRARQVALCGPRGTYQISQPGNCRSSSRRRSPCPTLSPSTVNKTRICAPWCTCRQRATQPFRLMPQRTHHLPADPARLRRYTRLRPPGTDAVGILASPGARSRASAPARLPAGQGGRVRMASRTPRVDTDPPDWVSLTMWPSSPSPSTSGSKTSSSSSATADRTSPTPSTGPAQASRYAMLRRPRRPRRSGPPTTIPVCRRTLRRPPRRLRSAPRGQRPGLRRRPRVTVRTPRGGTRRRFMIRPSAVTSQPHLHCIAPPVAAWIPLGTRQRPHGLC